MLRPYRKQSADLQSKSTDWFLYDKNISREKVKCLRCMQGVRIREEAKLILPNSSAHLMSLLQIPIITSLLNHPYCWEKFNLKELLVVPPWYPTLFNY